jgi:hypothetical protein
MTKETFVKITTATGVGLVLAGLALAIKYFIG